MAKRGENANLTQKKDATALFENTGRKRAKGRKRKFYDKKDATTLFENKI